MLMIVGTAENNILSVKAAYTICTDRAKADTVRLFSYYNQSQISIPGIVPKHFAQNNDMCNISI